VKEAGQQDTLNSALIGQTIQNQPKSTGCIWVCHTWKSQFVIS